MYQFGHYFSREVCCHLAKSVPSNLLMFRVSWVVAAVDSMMNVDTPARLFRNLWQVRLNLCRTESQQTSPISDRRPVSKNDPRRMLMNATNLEKRRCRYDMLITREAQNLEKQRGSCVE